MQYYKLSTNGKSWIKTPYVYGKKEVPLYDDNLKFYGIGLY